MGTFAKTMDIDEFLTILTPDLICDFIGFCGDDWLYQEKLGGIRDRLSGMACKMCTRMSSRFPMFSCVRLCGIVNDVKKEAKESRPVSPVLNEVQHDAEETTSGKRLSGFKAMIEQLACKICTSRFQRRDCKRVCGFSTPEVKVTQKVKRVESHVTGGVSPWCQMCQTIFSLVKADVDDIRLAEMVSTQLQKVCDGLITDPGRSKKCANLVSGVEDGIQSFVSTLVEPGAICGEVGVCDKATFKQ